MSSILDSIREIINKSRVILLHPFLSELVSINYDFQVSTQQLFHNLKVRDFEYKLKCVNTSEAASKKHRSSTLD